MIPQPPSVAPAIAAAIAPAARQKIRAEHGLFASACSVVVAATLGWSTSKDLAKQIEEARHDLQEMRNTLTEIKTQATSRDASSARLERDLADVVKELRDLERDRARDAEQLRELDRRIGSVEGRK